jgi:hypothetical protein
MASPPRINRRKACGGDAKPRNRGGRPSLDAIDNLLIEAIRRAAEASGMKVSRLIRVNVQFGLILGASQEATLRRLQTRAKHRR